MNSPYRSSRRSPFARILIGLVLVSILGAQSVVLTGCGGGGILSGAANAVGAVGRGIGAIARTALQNGPALAGSIVNLVGASMSGNPAAIVGAAGRWFSRPGRFGAGLSDPVLRNRVTTAPARSGSPEVGRG
ncbi:MAG: hypothetical protein HY815_07745 [Candidatus Riflebacteria bacterium]|nr:hypothetical protein [Candidatus Riflebacteria bacterium]